MKFTSLFIENFMLEMGLGGLGSLFPSLTTLSGSATQVAGSLTSIYSNSADDSPLTSTTILSTGTSIYDIGSDISDAGVNSYKKTLEQLNTTEAYIESLDYEELEDLIAKLENKEVELSIDKEKVLTNSQNKRI